MNRHRDARAVEHTFPRRLFVTRTRRGAFVVADRKGDESHGTDRPQAQGGRDGRMTQRRFRRRIAKWAERQSVRESPASATAAMAQSDGK